MKNNQHDLPEELSEDFYFRSPQEIAPDLLGCHFWEFSGKNMYLAKIVETEAYSRDDPACHAYRRKTPRNSAMFLGGGHYYVYKIYGIHHCINIVTGEKEIPEAVLIRAVELFRVGKGGRLIPEDKKLGSGPGKLCKFLGIDRSINGQSIPYHPKLKLLGKLDGINEKDIVQTVRIGITRGMDIPWRWYLKSSGSVSVRNKSAERVES